MSSKMIKGIGVGLVSLAVISVIASVVFFPSGNTRGSNWEQVTTIFFDTKGNTATYNVEAAGWDVRVIEWTPESNPNYRCMFVAGTGKAGSACYPIQEVLK